MASRSAAKLIPRASAPLRTNITIRPFTTSLPLQAEYNSNNRRNNNDFRQRNANDKSQKDTPVRHNPLVGNYVPARPASTPKRDSVSTEKPNATTTPSPSRAPASSAEVAPNADLPPRPPRSTGRPIVGFSTPSTTTTDGTPSFPYDATTSSPEPSSSSSSSFGNDPVLDLSKLLASRLPMSSDLSKINDPMSAPKVRTKAVIGRTVHVKDFSSPTTAMNAPTAISTLNRLVKTQGLRSKMHYQKFHERRGLKKKRLRRERWRVRFKTGFQATVARVMDLKRQGW